VRLSSWKQLGFDQMEDEIAAAFGTRVEREVKRYDADWRRYIWKRRRRLMRDVFRRRWLDPRFPQQRDIAAIRNEYDPVWERGYDAYCLEPPARPKPWTWRRRRYWANSFGATRFRQVILARVVERLRPRRVLEVGCGNGINLMLLACRFPDIEFVGLELTGAGPAAANRFQAENTVLPAPMQAFAPLPLVDATGFRRVRFVQGSAADMPFAGDAFDLTITVLALEQMERIRHRAIPEIARVTACYALMLEPFREFNSGGWRLVNRIRRDYFGGRVDDLPHFGLEPEFAIEDYPQEAFLHTCVVLCSKHRHIAPEPG
jgi:SAM-dependent methyltransferase